MLLAGEVGDLNIAADLLKELKCLITTESAQYGLEDPSCRPSARSQQLWRGHPQGFVRQGLVVRWRRHAPRDWCADGEGMQRQLCQGFFCSVTVSVEGSLGTKFAWLKVNVGMYMDLTLLHSCTFFPL